VLRNINDIVCNYLSHNIKIIIKDRGVLLNRGVSLDRSCVELFAMLYYVYFLIRYLRRSNPSFNFARMGICKNRLDSLIRLKCNPFGMSFDIGHIQGLTKQLLCKNI